MANPTIIQVNANAVRLRGVKHLTNAIRNSGSPDSIKTAEAIESQATDLASLTKAVATLNVSVPASVFTYQLENLG